MEVNQCQVCLNYFIDPTSLQNHIETHTKRELYQCIVILKSALSQVHSASQQVLSSHHAQQEPAIAPSVELVVHNGILDNRQNKADGVTEGQGVLLQRIDGQNIATPNHGETVPLPHYNGEISVIQTHKDRTTQSVTTEQAHGIEGYVSDATKLNQASQPVTAESQNSISKPDTNTVLYKPTSSLAASENVESGEVYSSPHLTPGNISRTQSQVDSSEARYAEHQGDSGVDMDCSKHGKGSKSLQCEICQKTFTTSFATRRHKMSHTNERPNTCTVCGKGFIGKQNLEVHYRVHTGEKPYACEVCGKKFTQHGSLYKHRERHQIPQGQTSSTQLPSTTEISPSNKEVGHNYEALRLLEENVDHRDNLDGLRLLEQIASEKEKIDLTPSAEVIAGEYEGDLHEEEVLEDGVVDHSAMNIIVPEQGMLMFTNYQPIDVKKDQYETQDQDKEGSAVTHTFEQGAQLLQGHIQEQTAQYDAQEDTVYSQNKEKETALNSEITGIETEQTAVEVRQMQPDGTESEQYSHENKNQEGTELNANADVAEGSSQSAESPGLQCKFCLVFCPTIFELQTHCSTFHSGPKPYRCNVCGRRFSASFCLRRHIMLHTGEKPFSCSYCGKGFIEKQHLQSHVRTHTGEKPYKCKVCEKSFTQYGTLHNHMQTHNKSETGTSTVAKKKSIKKEKKVAEDNNNAEQTAVSNGQPADASQTAINTNTPVLLHDPIAHFSQALSLQMQMYTNAKHLYANAELSTSKPKKEEGSGIEKPHKRSRRASHGRSPSRTSEQQGNPLEYQAQRLSAEKLSQQNLMEIKKEMATDLSNGSTYQPDSKSPSYARDLQTIADLSVLPNKELEAMAALTGKRQQCQYCELQFNSPITLERHLRTHRGQKPFACNFCQKSFSTSYCLRRHVMTHTGERPHGCHFCGKRFIEKQHLLIHTRVHTGEKPYQCKFCLKRFPQGGSLYRHVQIHTKGLKGFPQNDQTILDQIKMESTEANLPQNYTVSQSPMQPGLDTPSDSHDNNNKDEPLLKSEELKKKTSISHDGQVDSQRRDSVTWSGVADTPKLSKTTGEELSVKASEQGADVTTGEHLLLSPLSKELLANQYYHQHVKVKAESGYEDQEMARRASFDKSKQDSYDIISDIVRRDYLQQQFNYLLKNMDPYTQGAHVLNRQIMTSVAAAGVGSALSNHKDNGQQIAATSSDEPINLTDNKVTETTTAVCTVTTTSTGENVPQESTQNLYEAVNQNNPEGISCNLCGEKFATLSILHQHMSLAHSETTEHRCEICGEIFTMKEHLIIHYQMHTGDNSYLLQQFNTLRSSDAAVYQAYYNRLHAAKATDSQETNAAHEQPLDGTSTGDMKSHPRSSTEEERYASNALPSNTQISVISRQNSSHTIYGDTTSSVGLEMTPTQTPGLNTSTESAKLTETSDNLSTDSEGESDVDGQVSRPQIASTNMGQTHSVTSSISQQQHSIPSGLAQQTLHSLHSSPVATSTPSHFGALGQHQNYLPSLTSADTDKITTNIMPQFIQTGNILSSFSELASQVMRRNVMPTIITQGPSSTQPAIPRQLSTSPRQPSQVEVNSQINESNKDTPESDSGQATTPVDTKEKLGFKTFECEICRKQFLNKRSYYRHIRLHTGEQLCKCEICGKGFTGVFGLRRHMITHSGHKPHKCDFCGKGFIEKQHLECHRRIHTGEKPFKCDVCDKRFTQYGTLHRHKRIHTKEKPYGCPLCPKQFGENRQLTQHMKSHSLETANQIGEGIEPTNQIGETSLGLDLHTSSSRDTERDLNLSVQAVQSLTSLDSSSSQHTS